VLFPSLSRPSLRVGEAAEAGYGGVTYIKQTTTTVNPSCVRSEHALYRYTIDPWFPIHVKKIVRCFRVSS
jgi:hypothetical protein